MGDQGTKNSENAKFKNLVFILKKGLFHIWHGEAELASVDVSTSIPDWDAAKMFDDDFKTAWHSDNGDLNPTVTINLKVSFRKN